VPWPHKRAASVGQLQDLCQMLDARKEERVNTTCVCGVAIIQPSTGRPKMHCSDRCRLRAWRRETKAATVGETKQPDIMFYCGLNEKRWNHHAVEPGERVCIAPVTLAGETALRKTQVLIDDTKVRHVLLDSGAFSDGIELRDGKVVRSNRLSFDHALQRQIAHAYDFRYAHLVEAIVSYDLLIDETWQDGDRSKLRWSVESAEYAVNETIEAARYLASQRRRINNAFGHHVNLCLSAQGVDAGQYKRCTEAIAPLMRDGDVFGLGGWCITGLMRHIMLPAAATMLPGVFEVLGEARVKRVHVFGVILPRLLGFLLYLCDLYNIQLSTDSAGPSVEPARNGNWGYGSWTDPNHKVAPILGSCRTLDEDGRKAPSCTHDTPCRGLERARHVRLTREYLANFRTREIGLVCAIETPKYHQLSLEIAS
jgi:hypothetical protein